MEPTNFEKKRKVSGGYVSSSRFVARHVRIYQRRRQQVQFPVDVVTGTSLRIGSRGCDHISTFVNCNDRCMGRYMRDTAPSSMRIWLRQLYGIVRFRKSLIIQSNAKVAAGYEHVQSWKFHDPITLRVFSPSQKRKQVPSTFSVFLLP